LFISLDLGTAHWGHVLSIPRIHSGLSASAKGAVSSCPSTRRVRRPFIIGIIPIRLWGAVLSVAICEAMNRFPDLTLGAYVREPSVSRVPRTESVDKSVAELHYDYVAVKAGFPWSSTSADFACTALLRRDYVIRPPGRPKAGATERLAGSLGDLYPELRKLSERDIEDRLRRMRR